MKGPSVQWVENSERERFESLGIRFCGGMLLAYRSKEMWAQKKGRYRRSEKSFSQDTRDRCSSEILLYVENHVPRQITVEGGDLETKFLAAARLIFKH